MTGTTVTGIDPARSRVTIDDGRELVYDRLLLTTGAAPRQISIPAPTSPGFTTCARSLTAMRYASVSMWRPAWR
jgi:nitrite reductase (NADH) large subunit